MSNSVELTFLAEWIGDFPYSKRLYCTFYRLLQPDRHPEAYVREGALRGAQKHLEQNEIRKLIENVAIEDPEEEIRQLAKEILE